LVGAAGGISKIFEGGGDILGTVLSALGLKSLFKGSGGGPGLGAGPKVNGKFNLGNSLKGGLGKGVKGGLISIAASMVGSVTGDLISSGSEVGSLQSKAGGFVSGGASGAGLGALIGSVIPGVGTAICAGVGGLIGGTIGAFNCGENSTVTGASVTNTGGKGFTLIHPVNGPITTKYGTKDDLHPSGHYAVDYGVATGTPVKAAASGTVSAVGSGQGARSYGNNVEISHIDGFSTFYAHLNVANVRVGQVVSQGDVVAQSGNTGFSTGPHLHFELRKNGQKTDPSPYLGSGVSNGGTINSAVQAASGTQLAGSGTVSGAYTAGLSTGISNVGSIIPSSYKGAATGRSGGAGYSIAARGATIGRTSTQNGAMPGISTGGVGGDGEGVSLGGNNIVINLSIKEASEAEARKFANMVKTYLEDKTLITSMGRM
jgi:hypothetical protein